MPGFGVEAGTKPNGWFWRAGRSAGQSGASSAKRSWGTAGLLVSATGEEKQQVQVELARRGLGIYLGTSE